MNYFTLLFILIGFLYFMLVMLLIFALSNIRSGSSTKKPFVSVIIAARNESKFIGRCINALMKQDYEKELFEVIIVDDRSEDETFELLSQYKSIWSNLKIIRVDKVPEGISPKKNALSEATNIASGEIILETDADCIVPVKWISGMVSRFEEGINMVTGVAPYFSIKSSLNSFIRHEYVWNIALSAGSIAFGYGTHASARNLGFRRQAFEQVGEYGSAERIISGDDTLLMHRIQKLRKKGVATIPESSAHVYTDAPENLMSFLRQRARHMSTGKHFDPVLILTGVIFYGYHILTLASLVLSFISLHFLTLFVCSFLLKNILDGLVFRRVKNVFKLEIQWRRFIINELFLLVYMVIMPFVGLFFPVKWK